MNSRLSTINEPGGNPPDLDDYRWLVSPKAQNWLNTAHLAVDERQISLPALTARLRQQLSASRAHLVLEQTELRRKAADKFVAAGRMFFLPVALEQATDQWVACYKAARFKEGQPVADLCCGIGGDLLALAQRGCVWAVDRNPAAVILAEANLKVACGSDASSQADGLKSDAGQGGVKFDVADVADAFSSLSNVAAWHIDPDRRPAGRRTTKVELHDPGPEVLARLLWICPNAAIKLAPAADLTEPFWAEAELEWIGRGRQCRQLVAWFGDLAKHPGRRRATVLRRPAVEGESYPVDRQPTNVGIVAEPNRACEVAAQIGRYVFEPDAAVLAAKLEGALAAAHRLLAIAPGIAYFTADEPTQSVALDCFEVLEVMPYRPKIIKQWLANRGIGRLEVKKRGVPLDPAQVRREVLGSSDGAEEVTLLLARIGDRVTAILAKRVKSWA
ncbi:MAG TPA: class I SAM-dependent methyltransferase [Pirellulales bacterium]